MVAASRPLPPSTLSAIAAGQGFLSYGSSGASVAQLKSLLGAAGGTSLTGDTYDLATLQAVREFQAAQGLPSKGYLDQRTLEKLVARVPPGVALPALDPAEIDTLRARLGGTATRSAPQLGAPTPAGARPLRDLINTGETRAVTPLPVGAPAATRDRAPAATRDRTPPTAPTLTPTTAPTNTTPAADTPALARGATGAPVRQLQDGLVRLGLLDEGTKRAGYGNFGPATESSVRALQTSLGLPVTGQLDARTRAALDTITQAPTTTTDNPDVTRAMQAALKAKGLLPSPSGRLDEATTTALKAFQAQRRIQQTGVLGPQTFGALLGRGASVGHWPVPGYSGINHADKYGEGEGEFGTPRAGGRVHKGIDIEAPVGARVESYGPGSVVYAGQMDGYGNTVIVQHPGGRQTVYAHLGRIDVDEGQSVDAATRLGTIGRSGNVPSSGDAHLHFELREGASGVLTGRAVDPLPYLRGR